MIQLILTILVPVLKMLIDKHNQNQKMRESFYEFYRVYELSKNKSYEHMKDIDNQLKEEKKDE